METKNILLMVTGSVAAVKLPNLIRLLQSDREIKYNIKVTLTEHALHFISLSEIELLLPESVGKLSKSSFDDDSPSLETTPTGSMDKSLCYKSPFDRLQHRTQEDKTKYLIENRTIFRDQDEWQNWNVMGDPVLHIVLRNWADIGVIAPLDANTLGKMSSGICDNLITCILRAWDMSKKLIYAPAMNVNMWTHPLTDRCLKVPTELGYIRVGPITKKLACGDTGMGAMAEVEQIVEEIKKLCT